MFVELIDQLRCPEPHEDSWLVMHAQETRDRHVLAGTLGCPVCGRRYEVHGGTVYFGPRVPRPASDPVADPDAWALRLAAWLDLTEGGGAIGLVGHWARYAEALGDVVEHVQPLAMAPVEATHPMLSAIVPSGPDRLPVATGALRGVAVDRGSAAMVADAARTVRGGGRIVAPSTAPVPSGVDELARDAEWWVGVREAGTVVGIALRKR